MYCPPYSKDFTESSPKNGVHNMVHMVAERDTDSVAPTPTPQHPHHSQHHHLSLHEIRVLQVYKHLAQSTIIFFSYFCNSFPIPKIHFQQFIQLHFIRRSILILHAIPAFHSIPPSAINYIDTRDHSIPLTME